VLVQNTDACRRRRRKRFNVGRVLVIKTDAQRRRRRFNVGRVRVRKTDARKKRKRIFSVGRVLDLNKPISVYRFPRQALTLCPQLCMGFNLAPAFPRGALTLCPQLLIGISLRRYTEIGLLTPPTLASSSSVSSSGFPSFRRRAFLSS
jgi:hypothetical protein